LVWFSAHFATPFCLHLPHVVHFPRMHTISLLCLSSTYTFHGQTHLFGHVRTFGFHHTVHVTILFTPGPAFSHDRSHMDWTPVSYILCARFWTTRCVWFFAMRGCTYCSLPFFYAAFGHHCTLWTITPAFATAHKVLHGPASVPALHVRYSLHDVLDAAFTWTRTRFLVRSLDPGLLDTFAGFTQVDFHVYTATHGLPSHTVYTPPSPAIRICTSACSYGCSCRDTFTLRSSHALASSGHRWTLLCLPACLCTGLPRCVSRFCAPFVRGAYISLHVLVAPDLLPRGHICLDFSAISAVGRSRFVTCLCLFTHLSRDYGIGSRLDAPHSLSRVRSVRSRSTPHRRFRFSYQTFATFPHTRLPVLHNCAGLPACTFGSVLFPPATHTHLDALLHALPRTTGHVPAHGFFSRAHALTHTRLDTEPCTSWTPRSVGLLGLYTLAHTLVTWLPHRCPLDTPAHRHATPWSTLFTFRHTMVCGSRLRTATPVRTYSLRAPTGRCYGSGSCLVHATLHTCLHMVGPPSDLFTLLDVSGLPATHTAPGRSPGRSCVSIWFTTVPWVAFLLHLHLPRLGLPFRTSTYRHHTTPTARLHLNLRFHHFPDCSHHAPVYRHLGISHHHTRLYHTWIPPCYTYTANWTFTSFRHSGTPPPPLHLPHWIPGSYRHRWTILTTPTALIVLDWFHTLCCCVDFTLPVHMPPGSGWLPRSTRLRCYTTFTAFWRSCPPTLRTVWTLPAFDSHGCCHHRLPRTLVCTRVTHCNLGSLHSHTGTLCTLHQFSFISHYTHNFLVLLCCSYTPSGTHLFSLCYTLFVPHYSFLPSGYVLPFTPPSWPSHWTLRYTPSCSRFLLHVCSATFVSSCRTRFHTFPSWTALTHVITPLSRPVPIALDTNQFALW